MTRLLHSCPQCLSDEVVKSGVVQERQRYRCKRCNYHFTVDKQGKQIDTYYVIKALQLYLEGVSYREIERLLGVSHVSVMNWVKKYGLSRPVEKRYHPAYRILSHQELQEFIARRSGLSGHGFLITEVGDKFMLIQWERFRDY
jgi:transposase-like protein